MAIRIDRVYTRTGDRGETALVGGQRVTKESPRIEAFGTLDEVNSLVGMAVAEIPTTSRPGDLNELRDLLSWIQQKLFDLGAYLATPPEKFKRGMPATGPGDVERLEQAMDRWQKALPELTSFILPGGGKLSAWLHTCRTVSRRAERRVVRLNQEIELDPAALAFLNRLSDFFFVAARHAASVLGEAEVLWTPSPPETRNADGKKEE